jgi:hypothetical protein
MTILTGCKKDDDAGGKDALDGTSWTFGIEQSWLKLTFKSPDFTFSASENSLNEQGTYTIANNVASLTFSDGSTMELILSGNTLRWDMDGEVITFTKDSGGGLK